MTTDWMALLKRLTLRLNENLRLQLLASLLLCAWASRSRPFFSSIFSIRAYHLSGYSQDAAKTALVWLKGDFQSHVLKKGLSSGNSEAFGQWGHESGASFFVGENPAGPKMSVSAGPDGPVLSLWAMIRYGDGEIPTLFLYSPLRSTRFVSWTVSLLLAFDVFLIALFLVLRGKLDYILRIGEGGGILESGRLDCTIPVEGEDELARLAVSINLMSRSVQAHIQSEQRALQASREVVADLSHDIRTPLTVGMGYLALLLEKKNLSEEERREYLTLALKKAGQIEERTRALLEFATLTSGQAPVRKAVIGVRTMMDQLKEELAAWAELRVRDELPGPVT